jgi:ribulose 1,5-bisphosphate synthetase/thiazole synthase
VQNDAFQEIAESQIVIVGKGPQDLQKAFFHADAGLDAFNRMYIGRLWQACYLGTSVPR